MSGSVPFESAQHAAARRELVAAGHRLLAEGLVARTWGNLSVRVDENTIAVTPSGIAYPDLTEAMIVMVDLTTGEWSGPLKPTGERKVHLETYRRRPDVHAGIHTHQVAASVCAAARVPVQASFGEVPCAGYGLPGTKRITEATVGALGDGPAVLMANHGVFAVAKDLPAAFDLVEELESTCAALVAERRPPVWTPAPAEVDAPWDPTALSPIRLADGSPAWLSSAPYTVQFAGLGRVLPAVLDDLAQLVGTKLQVVPEVPSRRPRADAVLVAGRGALVLGADHEAVAMVVEKAARAWIGAQGLGGAHSLPAWEALLMRAVYVRSYSKQADAAHAPTSPRIDPPPGG